MVLKQFWMELMKKKTKRNKVYITECSSSQYPKYYYHVLSLSLYEIQICICIYSVNQLRTLLYTMYRFTGTCIRASVDIPGMALTTFIRSKSGVFLMKATCLAIECLTARLRTEPLSCAFFSSWNPSGVYFILCLTGRLSLVSLL